MRKDTIIDSILLNVMWVVTCAELGQAERHRPDPHPELWLPSVQPLLDEVDDELGIGSDVGPVEVVRVLRHAHLAGGSDQSKEDREMHR